MRKKRKFQKRGNYRKGYKKAITRKSSKRRISVYKPSRGGIRL